MPNKKIIFHTLIVISLSHALVDAACLSIVFGIFGLGIMEFKAGLSLIVLYNVIAFALQAPLGHLIDKYKLPFAAILTGIFLVMLATLLLNLPYAAVILAGLGNALFHVGGGIFALNLEPGKAALPGIYVAPGELGLFIGVLLGQKGYFMAWPFILLLLIAAFAFWKIKKPEINYNTEISTKSNLIELALLLFLLSIAVRGLVGLSLNLPWRQNIYLAVALTSGVFLGKMFGGILGDKIGWRKIALAGLLISAPLLSFFTHNPALTIIGAFFFNLTMPITLVAVAELLPGQAGFAFGLTTLALVTGAMPTFFESKFFITNNIIFLAIIFSIICLYLGLNMYFKKNFNHQTL